MTDRVPSRARVGRPAPRPTMWPGQYNLSRAQHAPASLSEGLGGDGGGVGPGRYLGPRGGYSAPRQLDREEYPESARLDDLMTEVERTTRPTPPRTLPGRDYTVWARQQALRATATGLLDPVKALLGMEHFKQPEKPAPRPVPAGKTYPIGTLAKRLGRSTSQMRTWIRNGWLPPSAHATGSGMAMRRRWTLAEIEVIVQAAADCGLMNGDNRSVSASGFPYRVADKLTRLDDEMRRAELGPPP
jgi:hypothetical protein